jgi:heat shock protein HslJ
VAPLAEDARFAPCIEEPNQGLLGEWEGVEIRYEDRRPSAQLGRVVVGFSPGGYVGWADGCNEHGGRYALQGNRVSVRDDGSTQMHCSNPTIELANVTAWRLDGANLVLESPTERYLLRRSPYSVLTRRPWSLYSITELASGETKQVERLRFDYTQLLIEAHADRHFTFTDFDYVKWSGSMTVGPALHAVELAWDNRTSIALNSRRRLRNHPEIREAKSPYPLGMAAELDLGQVGAFCLVESRSLFGPPVMLELRGDKYVYTLSPR